MMTSVAFSGRTNKRLLDESKRISLEKQGKPIIEAQIKAILPMTDSFNQAFQISANLQNLPDSTNRFLIDETNKATSYQEKINQFYNDAKSSGFDGNRYYRDLGIEMVNYYHNTKEWPKHLKTRLRLLPESIKIADKKGFLSTLKNKTSK